MKLTSFLRLFRRSRRKNYQRASVLSMRALDGNLFTEIELISFQKITIAQVDLMKFRDESIRLKSGSVSEIAPSFMEKIKFLPRQLLGLKRLKVRSEIATDWDILPSSIYRFFVTTIIGSTTVKGRNQKSGLIHLSENSSSFYYRDPVGSGLRLEHLRVSRDEIDELKLGNSSGEKKRIKCVLGEYTNSARDNGIAIFLGIKDDYLDVRYVIERFNIDNLDVSSKNIIEYGSKEHLMFCLDAEVAIFTHHSSYIFPVVIRHIDPLHFSKVKRFFVQHGVTALKNSMKAYHKSKTHYDAINVCSQLEQRIVTEACGYDLSEVKITGFPRHDNLLRTVKNAKADERRIIVFPTWRSGMDRMKLAEAEKTRFVSEWRLALSQMRSSGFHVTLIIHPIINHHASLFVNYADLLADASNFQKELACCSCLVTDYSSVCFDAIYVGKPVFFFVFDELEYGFSSQALIDVDTQLPGNRHVDVEMLVEDLNASRQLGWPVRNENAKLFFSNIDELNTDRCVHAIKSLVSR